MQTGLVKRRRRRQELKAAITDETALDADDSESHDEGVKECEERLRRIRITPADITAVAGTSLSYKNINVVLSEASPSGAGEKSQSKAADPSGAAGKTACLDGAGQPQVELFDLGQHTIVKALRKNMKINPCLRGRGEFQLSQLN
jgi:hypothetical protein